MSQTEFHVVHSLYEDLASIIAMEYISVLGRVLLFQDRIKAYRLEMGTKYGCNGTKDLYEYWKEDVSLELAKGFGKLCSNKAHQKKKAFLINCASQVSTGFNVNFAHTHTHTHIYI